MPGFVLETIWRNSTALSWGHSAKQGQFASPPFSPGSDVAALAPIDEGIWG